VSIDPFKPIAKVSSHYSRNLARRLRFPLSSPTCASSSPQRCIFFLTLTPFFLPQYWLRRWNVCRYTPLLFQSTQLLKTTVKAPRRTSSSDQVRSTLIQIRYFNKCQFYSKSVNQIFFWRSKSDFCYESIDYFILDQKQFLNKIFN